MSDKCTIIAKHKGKAAKGVLVFLAAQQELRTAATSAHVARPKEVKVSIRGAGTEEDDGEESDEPKPDEQEHEEGDCEEAEPSYQFTGIGL